MPAEEMPGRLIGGKACDSDALDEMLADHGIGMIAPHRRSRKPANVTREGRPLRRWLVERTIAWLRNYRRLCIRWEKSTKLFQGFLHFGCTLMLLKQVLG